MDVRVSINSSATILNPQEYVELTGLLDVLKEDEISILPQVPSTFPLENRPVIDRIVGPLSRVGWEENMPKAVRAVVEILGEEYQSPSSSSLPTLHWQ